MSLTQWERSAILGVLDALATVSPGAPLAGMASAIWELWFCPFVGRFRVQGEPAGEAKRGGKGGAVRAASPLWHKISRNCCCCWWWKCKSTVGAVLLQTVETGGGFFVGAELPPFDIWRPSLVASGMRSEGIHHNLLRAFDFTSTERAALAIQRGTPRRKTHRAEEVTAWLEAAQQNQMKSESNICDIDPVDVHVWWTSTIATWTFVKQPANFYPQNRATTHPNTCSHGYACLRRVNATCHQLLGVKWSAVLLARTFRHASCNLQSNRNCQCVPTKMNASPANIPTQLYLCGFIGKNEHPFRNWASTSRLCNYFLPDYLSRFKCELRLSLAYPNSLFLIWTQCLRSTKSSRLANGNNWRDSTHRTSLSFSAQILHSWNVLPISQYTWYCSGVTGMRTSDKPCESNPNLMQFTHAPHYVSINIFFIHVIEVHLKKLADNLTTLTSTRLAVGKKIITFAFAVHQSLSQTFILNNGLQNLPVFSDISNSPLPQFSTALSINVATRRAALQTRLYIIVSPENLYRRDASQLARSNFELHFPMAAITKNKSKDPDKIWEHYTEIWNLGTTRKQWRTGLYCKSVLQIGVISAFCAQHEWARINEKRCSLLPILHPHTHTHTHTHTQHTHTHTHTHYKTTSRNMQPLHPMVLCS